MFSVEYWIDPAECDAVRGAKLFNEFEQAKKAAELPHDEPLIASCWWRDEAGCLGHDIDGRWIYRTVLFYDEAAARALYEGLAVRIQGIVRTQPTREHRIGSAMLRAVKIGRVSVPEDAGETICAVPRWLKELCKEEV